MKTDTKTTGARYVAPSITILSLSFESPILSGVEGEPIDWDEEIEL